MFVDRFRVYQTGIKFRASLFYRDMDSRSPIDIPWNDDAENPLPDGQLILTIRYADGRIWSNVGNHGHPSNFEVDPPNGVVLRRSSRANGYSCAETFWVWPVPPPGEMTIEVNWLALDGPAVVSIDASQYQRLADEVRPIWPAES